MKTVALSIAMAAMTLAQTPGLENRAEFEVAAIHPAAPGDEHGSDIQNGRFLIHNLTLKRLIARAYDIDIGLITGGPNWMDSDSYDIDAKIPGEFVQRTREKAPLMLQSLLADRFQLVIHREPSQIAGYALVVAKNGPRMEHANPDEKGAKIHSKGTRLAAENVTMEEFAKTLSRNHDVGKLVVDKTGLPGRFKFELDWAPERLVSGPEPTLDDRLSIFAALQKQLGLKLESARIPVSAIVVDRAEKPGDN